jgi:HAD superfamily hydrolase (TIGR01509 family)
MPVDLVIFDCDGVLVDSEVISCRVHATVLTRNGYPITIEQVHDRFLGRSLRESSMEIEAELGRSLSDDFDVQVKRELFSALTATLQAMPHVDAALTAIAQPVCVASSGPPDKIRHSLTHVALYDRFSPNIFSAVQVERGKPAPDLFLFAAESMQAAPARCVVIEDSIPGIKGASAAGMTVLGFHGGSHCRPGDGGTLKNAGAVMTFDDMRQLPDLIARIGRRV